MSKKKNRSKKAKKRNVRSADKALVPATRVEKSLAPLDPLTAYINEVKKNPLLTEDEERRLAIKYQEQGDPASAYRLITSNLMLVVQIAMTYKREWQNMMDLIQEGNIGLMQAVKNFDPFRGVRLPVYASWWVKARILKFILDNWRMVRVGTTNTRRKLLYNLQKEKEKLELEGIHPTTKLLAEHFGVEEKEVIDVQASLGQKDVSMETPTDDDSDITPLKHLSDGLHPGHQVEVEEFRQNLRKEIDVFLKDLKPIEREIFETRVLSEDPRSLQAIGDNYNITREAVRQTEQRLLKKFKEYVKESLPDVAEYFQH